MTSQNDVTPFLMLTWPLQPGGCWKPSRSRTLSHTPSPRFPGNSSGARGPGPETGDCRSGFQRQVSPRSPGLVGGWAVEFAKTKGYVKAPGLPREPGLPPVIQPQVPGNNLPCSAPQGFKAPPSSCPLPKAGQVDVLIDLNFRLEMGNRGFWGKKP